MSSFRVAVWPVRVVVNRVSRSARPPKTVFARIPPNTRSFDRSLIIYHHNLTDIAISPRALCRRRRTCAARPPARHPWACSARTTKAPRRPRPRPQWTAVPTIATTWCRCRATWAWCTRMPRPRPRGISTCSTEVNNENFDRSGCEETPPSCFREGRVPAF